MVGSDSHGAFSFPLLDSSSYSTSVLINAVSRPCDTGHAAFGVAVQGPRCFPRREILKSLRARPAPSGLPFHPMDAFGRLLHRNHQGSKATARLSRRRPFCTACLYRSAHAEAAWRVVALDSRNSTGILSVGLFSPGQGGVCRSATVRAHHYLTCIASSPCKGRKDVQRSPSRGTLSRLVAAARESNARRSFRQPHRKMHIITPVATSATTSAIRQRLALLIFRALSTQYS